MEIKIDLPKFVIILLLFLAGGAGLYIDQNQTLQILADEQAKIITELKDQLNSIPLVQVKPIEEIPNLPKEIGPKEPEHKKLKDLIKHD